MLVCNANYLQNLARPKVIVNDWLTVTNWVPPVNEGKHHFRLLKAGNRVAATRTDYLGNWMRSVCRLSEALSATGRNTGESLSAILVASCHYWKKR